MSGCVCRATRSTSTVAHFASVGGPDICWVNPDLCTCGQSNIRRLSCGVINSSTVESTPSQEALGVSHVSDGKTQASVAAEMRPTLAVKPPATYQHIFKDTQKSSSLRCQAASREAAQETWRHSEQWQRKTIRQRLRRGRVKRRKQERKLRQVKESEASPRQRFSENELERSYVFFDGGQGDNDRIAPRLLTSRKERKREIVVASIRSMDVHVVQNTINGAMLRPDPAGDAIFILPPRANNLYTTGDAPHELIEALHDLERSTNNNHKRGANKVVMHQTLGTKYCCAGVRPNRDEPGVATSANVRLMRAKHWNHIVDYVVRCETSFAKWIDSNVLRCIRHARNVVGFPTMAHSYDGETSGASIFGSIAFGRNVYLNSHRDDDFTYSIVSVHRRLAEGSSKYMLDDEIICYFVFPRYGMAVPLRPGDVLIFNPQEQHCISSRVSNTDDVYCLSLYLKSAVVGLSDNSIGLTAEQQRCAEAYRNAAL